MVHTIVIPTVVCSKVLGLICQHNACNKACIGQNKAEVDNDEEDAATQAVVDLVLLDFMAEWQNGVEDEQPWGNCMVNCPDEGNAQGPYKLCTCPHHEEAIHNGDCIKHSNNQQAWPYTTIILLLLLLLRCLIITTDGLACILLTPLIVSEEPGTRVHILQFYKQQLCKTATTLQTARRRTAVLACFEAGRLCVKDMLDCDIAATEVQTHISICALSRTTGCHVQTSSQVCSITDDCSILECMERCMSYL